jgi:hypothetical protein
MAIPKYGTRLLHGSAPNPSQPGDVINCEREEVTNRLSQPSGCAMAHTEKENTMKYTIIAAAVAGLVLGGAAHAQVPNQIPATQGNSASDYGESPSGADLNTTQPSGGYAADTLSAPTGNLSGASMGAANMNGPTRDGQPVNPYLRNGDAGPSITEGY